MEIISLALSLVFFVSSILLRRKTNIIADSNKLFAAAQTEKFKEEKKGIETYKAECENLLNMKAREEKGMLDRERKRNEVLLYSIKESSLVLADHHIRFEKMMGKFIKTMDVDPIELNSLVVDSVNYRNLIETDFFKLFGCTTDAYKQGKIKLN